MAKLLMHSAGQPERRTVLLVALAWFASFLAWIPGAAGKDLAQYAQEFRGQLIQHIMPYWYDTAVDRAYGGYRLSDDAAKQAPPATEKQIVTQARMVWGFSHAHLNGLGDGKRNYLKAAEQGYKFLLDHFLDPQYGGYFWSTDVAGKPMNQRKIIYGQSFVIYAFVEYYRASGDRAALRHALDLYHVLQHWSHDRRNGGWIEHFERDWTPIVAPAPEAIVEVGGRKSANTHLHLLESLTELFEATTDPAVRKSLEEAVTLNAKYFFPKDPARSAFHRHLDWKPVTDPSSAGLSYGHNVEFAWLFIRAQKVLGRPLSWDHFGNHLRHALRYGYDHERGGLYSRGFGNQPATETDKIWWVQAEMLAALTDALQHRQDRDYAEALDRLLDFITRYQVNPGDGIWLDTVAADGTPKKTAKAHNWKANYHDVRALVKFIDAFSAAR
jgi:mannobiose 2-epimerase